MLSRFVLFEEGKGGAMSYFIENIAVNLKHLRASKGMSLDQVAEQTGVSKSMLAQLEKGMANPSIGVLEKLASGLRVPFLQLLDPPKEPVLFVNPNQIIPTKEVEGQYRVITCFPFEDNKQTEIYRIEVEPGGEYVSGGHGESTREYLVVTEGTMEIVGASHEQIVTEGMMYRFETDEVHKYRNVGNVKCSCICFFQDNHRV